MKSSAKNIRLTPVDDLFSTEESRADSQRERVVELPLAELHPFRNHPFKVLDDEKMEDTAQSIREHGVLVPAIVRPREEGGYEIVAGHRRHHASQIAGLDTMPAIIRDLDDDAATIIMVDSNLQRETLLPSERAWAYKMKLDAMKRQAGRPSKENCSQVGNNFSGQRSSELMAQQIGESKNQIFRFIRLTELIPPLLDMVDERKIAFNPAVELSYLKPEEQIELHQIQIGIPEAEQVDIQGLRKSGQMHKVRLTKNDYQLVAESAGQSPEVLMHNYNEALDSEKRALSRLVEGSFYPDLEPSTSSDGANDVSSLLERIQKNPDLRRQLVESLLLGAVGA